MQDKSRSITNDQRHIRKNPLIASVFGWRELDLSQKTPSCRQHDPHKSIFGNKHKLTETHPKIILQSSTRTIYDKEDIGFL